MYMRYICKKICKQSAKQSWSWSVWKLYCEEV